MASKGKAAGVGLFATAATALAGHLAGIEVFSDLLDLVGGLVNVGLISQTLGTQLEAGIGVVALGAVVGALIGKKS